MKATEAGPGTSVGAGDGKPPHTSLPAMFCRLARMRFTGVVYAECASGGGVFSFRDGRAVFFEDVREGHSVADSLLAQGLITKLQYVDIGVEVLNAAAESEDVVFCQQAVRLGVLTRAQVDQELDQRVRHHVVEAVGWLDCRVEVDPDPESVVGILDYPQEVGPLVYLGVRRFFDEERLANCVPNHDPRFVRRVGSDRDAIAFFGLNARESQLLARLSGDSKLGTIIDEAGPDQLELRRLVAVLHMAGLIELDEARSTDRVRTERTERRGIERAAGDRPETTGRYAAPFVREERLGGAVFAAPPPQAKTAAAEPARPQARDAGASRSVVAKHAQPAADAPLSKRQPFGGQDAGPLHPLLRDEPPSPTPPPRAPQRPPSRQVSSSQRLPSAAGAARGAQPGTVDPLASPPPAAASQRSSREWRPKRIGATLKRLDSELKHLRGAQHRPLTPVSVITPAPASSGRAGLDQLIRMRQATLEQRKAGAHEQAARASGAIELFRAAQDALQKQKFDRAHDLMAKVCAAVPDNATYALYHQWAAFRANRSSEDEVNKLRTSLREKVSDDELKAFAYYALGHIALWDKKEEAAERCFTKAIELDKENKDAVRHLRILELRRKAAEAEKGSNKFFGIDVGKKPQ